MSFWPSVIFNVNDSETILYQLKLLIEEAAMEQFASIFRKTLNGPVATSRAPIAHSLKEYFTAQEHIISLAKTRKQNTQDKNMRIAEQNLKYRTALQQKLDAQQKKHEKNRNQHLKKIKEAEGRKNKYAQEITLKFKNEEKEQLKARLKHFKQNEDQMQQFWLEKQLGRDKAHRTQSASKPLHESSLEMKKSLEMRQTEYSLNQRAEILKKHSGRELLVYQQVENKKANIHEPHSKQIEKNLKTHEDLLTTRESKFINDIGKAFACSEQVLKKNRKQLQSKIKGKLIDYETRRETIRSNFLDKFKSRSASLANCRCKKINNNVEEGITKSIVFQQKNRSNISNAHDQSPRNMAPNRRDFLVRSQSMRSSVSYNQQNLKQKKYSKDAERLNRESNISNAIKLKKAIGVEGNCYVRLINVK